MDTHIFKYTHDKNNRYSSFLFVWPSISRGIATILDLFGRLPNIRRSESANEADEIAVMNDWAAVMNDLCIVMDDYGKRHGM
jgi:hypothetical protein